jgi:uncharacterized protein YydD (DUF2326 family)
MKLLKLSSDNPKFKTLNFKEGLNILAGLQLSKEEKQTYNGIGKSFSLNLIHLLLGSTLDKNKLKEKKVLDFLSGYGAFYLDFEQNNRNYQIKKNFSENKYFINDKEVAKTNYPSELKKIIFGNNVEINVSFKQLRNIFARRYGGTYYSDIVSQQGRPTNDYYQMYTNFSLLGLDTSLIEKKSEIKDKLNRLEKARKVIEGYEALLEVTNLNDLKDEVSQLKKEKNEFVIAENYDKYKLEADSATQEINEFRNEIYSYNKAIIRKLDSIKQSQAIDIDVDKIKRIYNEANFYFQDKISVRLEQANEFHKNLMNSRLSRLQSEIDTAKNKVENIQQKLKVKELHRDSILKDLSSKGALEEYNSISERIRTLEGEVSELEKYKNMLEGFKNDEVALKLENAKIQALGVEYLNKSKEFIESIELKFRTLVKRFYTNSGGSFNITPTKDAKYLFNIDVHVPRDGSQGVNEVKIFCYDFLLYQLNSKYINFMAHDGCIFSEMDPRQKSMIFKVALEHTRNNNLQYFVNIGQASLNEVIDENKELNVLTESERKDISDSVILELFDKDPKNWLFGTSFG